MRTLRERLSAYAAKEAEGAGLDSLWIADRIVCPQDPVIGYPPSADCTPGLAPIETLTFIAAITSRIGLGTSAVLSLFHPPVILAQRLATLDLLSEGRLIAGLVQGWMPEEFEVAGVPISRMGRAFDEHLEAMRAAWGPDPVSFEGRIYTIPEAKVGPKPTRTIPIVMGYHNEKGIMRAARIADGLHPYTNDLAKLRNDIELFRRTAEESGRDPSELEIVLRADGGPHDGGGEQRPLFHGEMSGWIEDLI